MTHFTLTERIHSWNDAVQVDDSHRLVRNVALTGTASRNGYAYAESALIDAVALYNGKPVFLDHADRSLAASDRSTRDLVGSIENAHFQGGRIRGDIRVLETPSGELFLGLVAGQSPGVGMSHVVLAERSPDGKVVTKIEDVISVDVVVNPATTTTFTESTTFLHCDASLQAKCSQKLEERFQKLIVERKQLLQQIETLRAELQQMQSRETLRKKVQQAGLSEQVMTECFWEQLLMAQDSDKQDALIQDRLSLLKQESTARVLPVVQSHGRNATLNGASSADELFLSMLRRR